MKNTIKTLLAAGALVAGVQQASANTINLANVSDVAVVGGSQWTYNVNFDNSRIVAGSYFTVVDFGPASLIEGISTLGTGVGFWTMSSEATSVDAGILLLGLSYVDNPSIDNVVFTYTGPDLVVPNDTDDWITLQSPYGNVDTATIAYLTKDTSAATPHNLSRALGPISGPNAVPDGGATAALLGLGFLGLGFLGRRK